MNPANAGGEQRELQLMREFAETYTRNALARQSDTANLVRISSKLKRFSDQKSAQYAADKPPLACRSGCSYCCHQPVGLSAPEVLELAEFIRANFTPEQILAMVGRLDAQEPWTRKKPCPLLGEEGKCTVYDARPFACRAQHSLDVEPCRHYLMDDESPNGIPMSAFMATVPFANRDGLCLAVAEKGIPMALLRLDKALSVALKDLEVGEKFLTGENVFANAIFEGSKVINLTVEPKS